MAASGSSASTLPWRPGITPATRGTATLSATIGEPEAIAATIGVAETLIGRGEIDAEVLARQFAANYQPERGYGHARTSA
jgi:hypothetical protein